MSRVHEILSWYGSDNPGTLTNLSRMLNHGRLAGTGKMVILPVDQGIEHSAGASFAPNPQYFDAENIVELAVVFSQPRQHAFAPLRVAGRNQTMRVVLVQARDTGGHDQPPRRASSNCRTRIIAGRPPFIM